MEDETARRPTLTASSTGKQSGAHSTRSRIPHRTMKQCLIGVIVPLLFVILLAGNFALKMLVAESDSVVLRAVVLSTRFEAMIIGAIGVYMLHPIVIFLAWLATDSLRLSEAARHPFLFASTIVFTFLIAAASYRWLETPFLRLKDRFGYAQLSSPKGFSPVP